MKIDLDDYREELIKAAPELEDTLEGLFHEWFSWGGGLVGWVQAGSRSSTRYWRASAV